MSKHPVKILIIMDASPSASASNLIAIVQHYTKIQDIHDTLVASYGLGDSERIAITLDSSIHKLKLFQNTWLVDAANPITRSETLWGKDGWADVQRLLAKIAKTIEQSKVAMELFKDAAKDRRKLFWVHLVLGQLKRPRVLTAKLQSILDLALELDETIDELWIHSEVLFESLRDIPARTHGPPARDQQASRSLPVRQGALALYQACLRSTIQCELNLDLLTHRDMPPDPQNTPRSVSETSLFYHMLVESADPEVGLCDIIAESFDYSEAATTRPTIKTHAELDLADFKSSQLLSSHMICVQPSHFNDSYYFRVAVAHTVTAPVTENETLALELHRTRTSTEAGRLQSLSLSAKLDLAYNLVQCGFYLLGTPWLASLSSKHIRRIETEKGNICVLGVKTLPLDEFYLYSPDALSESSQLFQIGMILIELALNGPEKSDQAKYEDPYLYAFNKLPLVQKAIGSKYYRACAFCIKDRRSVSSYGRPEKYKYPQETGWDVYLKDLLEDYHVQVVSR